MGICAPQPATRRPYGTPFSAGRADPAPTNGILACATKVSYPALQNLASLSSRVSQESQYIAVVDDEPAVCKAFERLLRAAKFDVATFSSGSAFLASLNNRMPACVVLDLHMPDMNGFDVQSHLASSPTNQVGVVVVTAHDSPESKQRSLAGGAAAYLTKPLEAKTLVDAIRAAIAGKAS